MDVHCCRLTGVVWHGCIYHNHSDGHGGSAAEGTTRETLSQEQAIDVRMADMLCDQQPQSGRVAYQAALQVAPASHPTMSAAPTEVATGQPMQIDMATPLADQAESQGIAESPDPTAVVTLSEERLLELATSPPAMRTVGCDGSARALRGLAFRTT